jgi:hypothetical protein
MKTVTKISQALLASKFKAIPKAVGKNRAKAISLQTKTKGNLETILIKGAVIKGNLDLTRNPEITYQRSGQMMF